MRLIIVTYLIICSVLSTFAQDIVYRSSYTTDDHLMERVVKSVTRDQEGKFWLLFDSGIQLFDGYSFTEVDIPLGLNINLYQKISALKNGELILHNLKERIHIDPQSHLFGENIQSDSAQSFIVSNAHLWKVIYTDDKIKLIKSAGDKSKEITIDNLRKNINAINDLSIIKNKLFLLADNHILYEVSKNEWREIERDIIEITAKFDNQLWLRKKGYTYLCLNESLEINQLDHLYGKACKSFKDQKGAILIGELYGQFELNNLTLYNSQGEFIKKYTEIDKILNTQTDIYSEDFTKRLLCTSYKGLWYFNLDRRVLTHDSRAATTKNRLGRVISAAMYRPKDQKVYYATENSGLFRLSGNQIEKVLPNEKYPHVIEGVFAHIYNEEYDVIYGIKFLAEVNTILTEYNVGLNLFQEHQLSIHATNLKIINNEIWVFGRHNDKGRIIILNQLTKKEIKTYDFDFKVYDVVLKHGKMYVATKGGLYIYNTPIESTNLGTLLHLLFENKFVITLNSTNEHIMAAVVNEGLALINNQGEIISRLSSEQGFSNNIPCSIHKDNDGYYWVGTFNGINLVDSNLSLLTSFTEADGMISPEANTFAICQDRTGGVFFGTTNGLAEIKSNKNHAFDTKRKIVLKEWINIKNGTKTIHYFKDKNQVVLPFGTDSVIIDYGIYDYPLGPSQKLSQRKQIKVKSSNLKDKVYNSSDGLILKPDGYGYRIVSIGKNINVPSKIIDIYKESFFGYYKWYILSYALSGSLLLLLARSYRKRIKDREQTKEAEYQSKINRTKLHALQSQMNPHFIFNALGSIQYFIQTKDTEAADGYLADFASLMRLILESSKSELIPFKNELNLLKLYTKLEHLRFNQKFNYKFIIDEDIDGEFMMPPMMIQPFIENAILHGFQHLQDHKGLLTVHFESNDDDHLRCTITDNGIGRKKSAELKIERKKSRGLQIVHERIESIRNSNGLTIDINTEDLYDQNSSAGTKVAVNFRYL